MPDPYYYLETICTQKPSKAEAGMTLMILAIRPFAESSESRHAPQWRRMTQEQSSTVPLRKLPDRSSNILGCCQDS